MQAFKETDEIEKKVRDILLPLLTVTSNEKTEMYNGAYTAYPLGDVLYDLMRSPLARNMSKESFRTSFFAIHELFTRPGTFEFYMDVFRAVFGDDVDVEFTVPAPGKLLINVEALDIVNDLFMARSIVDNQYVQDEVIDEVGDNIVFQGTQGLKTQREVEALIYELYPAGLWVQTTLVIT